MLEAKRGEISKEEISKNENCVCVCVCVCMRERESKDEEVKLPEEA